ncbi:hypothetical protein RLO149_c028650 [Roseobacter litoralis Och 149]|uniref:Uncharacterized protein n=1 Tax=Roseobacter litoralis (strain ATCC 49566 / DSM 6996 / JCM 21268 / NBRC 15278 / OCh 149) TaxID=391595 RepID=F7ZG93_ROSLO|nr:hypothetical protein RLO149_c028650 [Roseobacter litoralis Och 149]
MGPAAKAVPFIKSVLDPTYAISAVSKDGSFLSAAGFKTTNGAFIGGRFDDLAGVYGYFGAVLRGHSRFQFVRCNGFWQKNATVRFSSFSTKSVHSGSLQITLQALVVPKALQLRV